MQPVSHAPAPRLFDPARQGWVCADRLPRGTDILALDDPDTDELARSGLRLRHWRPDDAAALAALLDDDSLWSQMPEPRPAVLTRETARLLILAAASVPDTETRAVVRDDQPIGQVRLVRQGRQGELSYWLGRAHRGQGLGRRLVRTAVRRILAHCPDLHRLTARVRRANAASQAVLRGAGFIEMPARKDPAWLWLHLRGSAATRLHS